MFNGGGEILNSEICDIGDDFIGGGIVDGEGAVAAHPLTANESFIVEDGAVLESFFDAGWMRKKFIGFAHDECCRS